MLTKKFTSVQYKIPLKTNTLGLTFYVCRQTLDFRQYTSMTNNSSFLLFYDESYVQRHGTYTLIYCLNGIQWMNAYLLYSISLQCIVTCTRDQNERKSSLFVLIYGRLCLTRTSIFYKKEKWTILYLYIWFLKHF